MEMDLFRWLCVAQGKARRQSLSNYAPLQIEWASKLRYQATENNISFFMKQLGGVSDKRHDLADMPLGLRVREFPQ